MNIIDWLKRLLTGTPRTEPGQSPFAPGTGPARLLILRHGEKTGDKNDPYLSQPGQARAETLAAYIPETSGKPDFLIAAKTSRKSQRPYDTLKPLAESLGLDIMEKFDDEEVDALVAHLGGKSKYAGKFGVISWRHSDIPALLEALGAPAGSYPQDWDYDEYKLMFEVRFADGRAPEVRRTIMPF